MPSGKVKTTTKEDSHRSAHPTLAWLCQPRSLTLGWNEKVKTTNKEGHRVWLRQTYAYA
jgi:hypothetical protein